jgi:hypothetical protein
MWWNGLLWMCEVHIRSLILAKINKNNCYIFNSFLGSKYAG